MFFRKNHQSHTFFHAFERYADIHIFTLFLLLLFLILCTVQFARGSTTANFSLSILPQPLAVTVVDSEFNIIGDPVAEFSPLSYANTCREIITPLTTEEQQIYVRNFDAADNGWTVTISAENPASHWSRGEYAFDFNDPTADGCIDGDDPDTLAGSMTLYTESSSLNTGLCSACSSDSVIQFSSGFFDEDGGVNSVTLVYASESSNNRGDWRISDIMIRQTIPAFQPAVGNYEIPLLLSITAN